jgi:spore coat polysaccharide biosynthesis protein SpsF (cytidylyltransferase family)
MMIKAIVQARMSSKRLAGKVLMPIAGKPLLAYLFERLALCRNIDGFVLATSVDASDDPVVRFCREKGVACIRGPLEDVAARLLGAADELNLGAFVRINADSPFMDPVLVDKAALLLQENQAADLVTNVFPRSFPKGQSVEALRVKSLRKAYERMITPEDKEHVTRFFYAHPNEYQIVNFVSEEDVGLENLCVDSAQDLAAAERIVLRMDRPLTSYGWKEILELKGRPWPAKRN